MICEIGLSYCRATKVVTPIYGEVNITQSKFLEFENTQKEILVCLLHEFVKKQISKRRGLCQQVK